MSRALVVTDVQRDFCEGGSLAVVGGAATAARIGELLRGNHGYDYVVATRDHHIDPGAHFSDHPDFVDSWPAHCVAGSTGAELHEPLSTGDFVAVFDKGEYAAAYSGFEGVAADGQTLPGWLAAHDVDAVDVCGIATDYCVRATALDAAAAGFPTTVLLDLTAGVSAATTSAALSDLRHAGVTLVGEPVVAG